jgi:hypothetical protein
VECVTATYPLINVTLRRQQLHDVIVGPLQIKLHKILRHHKIVIPIGDRIFSVFAHTHRHTHTQDETDTRLTRLSPTATHTHTRTHNNKHTSTHARRRMQRTVLQNHTQRKRQLLLSDYILGDFIH